MTLIYALLMVIGLAGIDFVLGVLIAFKGGTFSIQKLPSQLETTVLPYVGSLVAVLIPQMIQADGTFSSKALAVAVYTIATTASLKLAQDVAKKAISLAG